MSGSEMAQEINELHTLMVAALERAYTAGWNADNPGGHPCPHTVHAYLAQWDCPQCVTIRLAVLTAEDAGS